MSARRTENKTRTEIPQEIATIGKKAKESSLEMAQAGPEKKNKAISFMLKKLKEKREEITEANGKDLDAAEKKGIAEHLRKRLVFSEKKITSRIRALNEIIGLPDPVGNYEDSKELPSGIIVQKLRVPIGVIGMIYESRPHVTINAGALCLKSGNSVILKGGSETIHSNLCLGKLWQDALEEAGLPKEAIQVIPFTEHKAVNELLKLYKYIDIIIPRGGKQLIDMVTENSKIPVIKHYQGICHTYVDEEADLEMAENVCLNAKIYAPEVCNAMETLLIAEEIAPQFLPIIAKELEKEGVEMRGCAKTREIIPEAKEATEQDWKTEYLDSILSIMIVKDIKEAINHINLYGSHHTDSIISENPKNCQRFIKEVDSGVVLVNASTMLNDASDLGMGAEIGISTDKLHARGPMGLKELTTYKLVIQGKGHIKK